MRILLLIISVFLSQSVMASTLKLDYSLFFGYMKTMYKLDYQYVTTAFYLREQSSENSCDIDSAEIVVDNKREPIEFKKEGQLLPFYSDEHRKDGAKVEVNTVTATACKLQVTIMAKESELTSLSFEKLTVINTQLEGVLRKNAGMIGKYFLPDYSGLRLKLVNPLAVNHVLPNGFSLAENSDLLITSEALMKTPSSQLVPYEVSRITPWIAL